MTFAVNSVCSTVPFPLPWNLVPRNIFLCLAAGYTLLTDTRIKSTNVIIRDEVGPSVTATMANELDILKSAPPGLRILGANSLDIDYPSACCRRISCPEVHRAHRTADPRRRPRAGRLAATRADAVC
jgi:hypothetical protein